MEMILESTSIKERTITLIDVTRTKSHFKLTIRGNGRQYNIELACLFPLTNIQMEERALLWWLPDVTDERVQAGQRVAGYLMTGVSVIFSSFNPTSICMHAACASSVGASHQGTLIRLNICEINQ